LPGDADGKTDGLVAPVKHACKILACWHYEIIAIQINIRDVPEKVRDELAARAALQGKSMQEFLRAELERLAARPSIDAWLQQVRKRKRATQTRISSKQILENRNADRR
jgi:plasmid stability protein